MFFLLGSEQKISSDQFLQNELQEIRNLIEQSKIKNDRTKSNLESLRSRLEKFNDILNCTVMYYVSHISTEIVLVNYIFKEDTKGWSII